MDWQGRRAAGRGKAGALEAKQKRVGGMEALGPGGAGQAWSPPLPGGLVVRIRRSHRRGPGSIPGQGSLSSSSRPTYQPAQRIRAPFSQLLPCHAASAPTQGQPPRLAQALPCRLGQPEPFGLASRPPNCRAWAPPLDAGRAPPLPPPQTREAAIPSIPTHGHQQTPARPASPGAWPLWLHCCLQEKPRHP